MGTATNEFIPSAACSGGFAAIDQTKYDRLRRIASSLLRRECRAHSLEPEDLLQEVLLRWMKGLRTLHFEDWDHLRRTATTSMRRLLVDHARADKAAKRGGGAVRVELHAHAAPASRDAGETVDLAEALRRLEKTDWRKYRVAEMHLMGAFSLEEIANELSVSTRTVKRDWRCAKGFLGRELRTQDFSPTR